MCKCYELRVYVVSVVVDVNGGRVSVVGLLVCLGGRVSVIKLY